MASGACEIFLDALILTLPISVVVRMRFSLRRKLTVLSIFLLGGLYVSHRSFLVVESLTCRLVPSSPA